MRLCVDNGDRTPQIAFGLRAYQNQVSLIAHHSGDSGRSDSILAIRADDDGKCYVRLHGLTSPLVCNAFGVQRAETASIELPGNRGLPIFDDPGDPVEFNAWMTDYCGQFDPENTCMRFSANEMRKAFNAGSAAKNDLFAQLYTVASAAFEGWCIGDDIAGPMYRLRDFLKSMRVEVAPLPEREIDVDAEITGETPSGVSIIADERLRQIAEEDYSAEGDDSYSRGELAAAGASYALAGTGYDLDEAKRLWPFDPIHFKPAGVDDLIRDLRRGGALIAAEIDRLLRNGFRERDRAVMADEIVVPLSNVSFSTPDPTFDPNKPVKINGIEFVRKVSDS